MNYTIDFGSQGKSYSIPKPEITFDKTKVSLQSFSYPHPMINYFKKNPATPKLCRNLLKSCKYFYSQKDLVIPLNYHSRNQIWKFVSSKNGSAKYKLPFKVWLTEEISLSSYLSDYMNEALYFVENATRCNLTKLALWNYNISLNDFRFLTMNGLEKLENYFSSIMYANGEIVPIEIMFESLKNIKYVYHALHEKTAKLVTRETAKKLANSIDTSKLKTLYLFYLPQVFDNEWFKKFTDAHPFVKFDICTLSNA